jgi:hypothetical protein
MGTKMFRNKAGRCRTGVFVLCHPQFLHVWMSAGEMGISFLNGCSDLGGRGGFLGVRSEVWVR